MERRTFATFRKQWPEMDIIAVTSPPCTLKQYPTSEITISTVISVMVGDLQRIKEYPQLGYQVLHYYEQFNSLVAYDLPCISCNRMYTTPYTRTPSYTGANPFLTITLNPKPKLLFHLDPPGHS